MVPNASQVIGEIIPGARVTSGLRGPNDPLTKANPRSFHTTGGAVDIKPIPGMTFAEVAERLRAAGYKVHPDSRDEVKNPSGHATGPHWHFVIGK